MCVDQSSTYQVEEAKLGFMQKAAAPTNIIFTCSVKYKEQIGKLGVNSTSLVSVRNIHLMFFRSSNSRRNSGNNE